MNQTLRRSVRITNPQGLHMRPAAAFAELATRFESSVTLRRGDQAVDGKNWVELLLLTAEEGAELMLEVCGQDAARALDALANLLGSASVDQIQSGRPPK